MKKNSLKIIMIVFSLVACNTNSKENSNREKEISDSLRVIVNEKDSAISNFLTLFTGIQKNLDSMSRQEKRISLRTKSPENLKAGSIEEINKDIKIINEIIKDNRKSIHDVNNKLKRTLKKTKELEQAMNVLNQQLLSKETDLTNLKATLEEYDKQIVSLETAVGILNAENAELLGRVDKEGEMLHTAYYITASSNELKKAGVIDKKGGLLGIGKTTELKQDFNSEKFTKIDYESTTVIPLNSKKIEIITNHATGSYKLNEEKGVVKSILITDPDKFWSVSKYLVVMKD